VELDYLGNLLTRFAKSVRGTEPVIVGSVGILSMLTGVISVAIVGVGRIVSDLGSRFGINEYRRANLMDCAGVVFAFLVPWTVHAVIPSMITSQSHAGIIVPPSTIPMRNFYSWVMLAMLIFAILTGYGRGKVTKPQSEKDTDS